AGRELACRGRGVPGDQRLRIPELLHALRAQHQPRRQFDHLHARRPDRLRGQRTSGTRRRRPRLDRRAPRGAALVQRVGERDQPPHGVGERLPQLVHDGLGPQHQQLARPHLPVPVPGAPLRPRQIPGHAQTARRRARCCRGRCHRRGQPGMTTGSRSSAMSLLSRVTPSRASALRLPPGLPRLAARPIGRPGPGPGPPLGAQRRRLDRVVRTLPVPRGTSVTGRVLDGVRAEVVTASGVRPERTVVHFHGGGYCIGSPRMMRAWAAHLSAQAHCRVVVPDYRLAPAHPHPAGLDDARAVLNALFGEDAPGSVVVSGDSAGAGLALSLLPAPRDAGAKPPPRGMLMSPWLDPHPGPPARAGPVRTPPVVPPRGPGAGGARPRPPRPRAAGAPPRSSPLLARHDGLPPLLLQAASDELLAPDAERAAASASAAGADVTYTKWPRMWHDFILQPGLVAAADSAVSQAAWFVTTVTGS